MQKGKSGKLSDPTTGAAALGMKTGSKVPYAEMGYAVPKQKPKVDTRRPSMASDVTGPETYGAKPGSKAPRNMRDIPASKPKSNAPAKTFGQMLGIKKK
jgi:hypothetical protein